MATITIGSVDYDVYTTVATADDYLAADIELGPTSPNLSLIHISEPTRPY